MYVDNVWCEIDSDRQGNKWLFVDGACTAHVLNRNTLSWEDCVGNKHVSHNFPSMCRTSVRIYNAIAVKENREKVVMK